MFFEWYLYLREAIITINVSIVFSRVVICLVVDEGKHH